MTEHKSADRQVTADQVIDRWALPPELDEAGKYAMRAKAAAVPVDHHAFGHMSDEWIADRVRMLMRQDMWHEAICSAGRDRIMRLSLEVERLKAELKEATRCKHPTKRGTGSISTDGKIVTSELWCDTCGEKLT